MQGSDERLIRRHIRKARSTTPGEHQLEEYVAKLDPAECVGILLAARRDECRVRLDETRGFEEVSKARTLEVLSGMEGG